MSEFKRADRVGDQIQVELADIILKKIKDPRVGFMTVTRVELSDDLKHARVYFSVLGDEAKKKETLKGLRSAGHFIRGEIGRRLKLRYTPELVFLFDESIQRGDRMLELLRSLDIKDEDEAGNG